MSVVECDSCETARIGCGCDGAYDDGCFLCSPESHERPPCTCKPPVKFRARVTVTPEPYTASVELTFISSDLLVDGRAYLVTELLNLGIENDQEVVALLRDVPAGADVRKLTGAYGWLVADDKHARKVGVVETSATGRVLVIADGYRVSLWDGELHVAVWLHDLVGDSVMSDLAYATEDK